MKSLFTVSLALLCYLNVHAQKDLLENEQLLKQYLEQKKFDIDTSAQAVVLYEKGITFVYKDRLEYKIDRIVKILSKDAIPDFGTITISKGQHTAVNKIIGETYNLENGAVVKQTIERADILKDKITEDVNLSKYNLPSVKAGSIIHYSYVVNSPSSLIFLPEWTFQDNYPVLYSEYELTIPNFIVVSAVPRVNGDMVKVDKLKDLANHDGAYYTETIAGQTTSAWVRKNIPAFKKEPYMSSGDNYRERVKIYVTHFSENGHTIKIFNSWPDISQRYYENKEFCGQAFAGNGFLSDKVEELTAGKASELDKAKAIFSYVRDNHSEKNYNSNNNYNANNIKEIFNKHEGAGTGINLLLTAMLRKAGLNSEPVLLATKAKERLNEFYPDPENCNYLASRVKINNKDYFLDASEKQMPFGTLLPECYNGYARVISEKSTAINLDPDSLLNKTTIMASLTPVKDSPNHFLLKVDEQFGTLTGMGLRKTWKGDSTEARKMVIKQVNEANSNGKLKDFTIKNLNNPDMPLALHYEADVVFEEAETIYFDPYISNFFDKNPFAAAERKYTIEMDCKEDINYTFRLQLPQNYIVDDYPKSVIYKFTDDELMLMKNIMNYDSTTNSFSLNSRFTTKATIFSSQVYSELRDFYERTIEEQNKKIVLKKLN